MLGGNVPGVIAVTRSGEPGNDPKYTPTELELFRTGLDPDLYPNVNWRDVILNKHVWQNQEFLSIAGGGTAARYYLSLSIMSKDGEIL